MSRRDRLRVSSAAAAIAVLSILAAAAPAAARNLPAALAVSPTPVVAGEPMGITGCGFRPTLAVSGQDKGPAGTEYWGAMADAAGCIAVDRRASLAAGSHTLYAYQRLKGTRSTLVALLAFTVAPRSLSIVSESYHFQWDATKACIGEDDRADFTATGLLAAGGSWTFTPRYPQCDNQRAVMVRLTSPDSTARLELSTVVRADDGISDNPAQAGTPILASSAGGSARVCMFPSTVFELPAYHTIVVRNLGTAPADVTVVGKDRNDWITLYWADCVGADADRDGWSDAVEHAMAQLLYPTGNQTAGAKPAGADYLRACGTPAADDEFDAWPLDLDDDGAVTQADVDRVAARVGQGNGVPWSSITPNLADPNGYWNHAGEWNRFDLDADGRVTAADVDLVRRALGARCP